MKRLWFVSALAMALNVPAQQPTAAVQLMGGLKEGFGAHATIGPGVKHRYSLPSGGRLFVHVLVKQISADIVVRLRDNNGVATSETDASSVGWESVPFIVEGQQDGLLELEVKDSRAKTGDYDLEVRSVRPVTAQDEKHVEAAALATLARKSASEGTTAALESAAAAFRQALSAWQASGDQYGEVMSSLSLATLSYAMSRFEDGVAYSKRALGIAVVLNDMNEQGAAWNDLAICEIPLGLLREARSHMSSAAIAFQNAGMLFGVAATDINLGILEYESGHWSDALLEYGKGLALARQLGNPSAEAYALYDISVASVALGDLEAATSFLEQSRAVFNRSGNKAAAARAASNLGRVRFEAGDPKRAEQLIRQAVDASRQLPDSRTQAEARNFLGQVLEKTSPLEALREFRQSLELYHVAEDQRGEANALRNLGHLQTNLAAGEEGLGNLKRALEIRRSIGIPDLVADSLYSVAAAESARGGLKQAREHAEEALRLIEQSRAEVPGEWLRSNYFARHSDVYEFMVGLLMDVNARKPESHEDRTAFLTHERSLARSLLEKLGITRAQIVEGIDEKLLRRSEQLVELINFRSARLLQISERPHQQSEEKAAHTELDSAIAEYRLAEAQVRASSAKYRTLAAPRLASIEEIQKSLDSRSLLIEFALGETKSYLWAISDRTFRSYRLPPRQDIDRRAAGFLQRIESHAPASETGEISPDTAALADILARPLADVAGRNRLFIVPDGKLAEIPFAAIPVGSPEPGSVRMLADAWEITMLPSVNSAIELQRRSSMRSAPKKAIAVLADPVFEPGDERVRTSGFAHFAGAPGFQRLAFTRQEARAILSLKPSPLDFLGVDFDATVANARRALSEFRNVHFSTHAFVDPRHPETSGLLFSQVGPGGEKKDGFLRVPALLNIDIRAQTVVLSACSTATGQQIETEGVAGLTQALLYGGAGRVVSSLWPVDEFASKQFMSHFYENMLARGDSPSAALRNAQLWMKNTPAWMEPVNWAAFEISGSLPLRQSGNKTSNLALNK